MSAVINSTDNVPPGDSTTPDAISYGRFTDRARMCWQLANQEAIRLHHEWIAPEHILVGLLKEGSSVACSVLANLANPISLRDARAYLESIWPPGPEMVTLGKLPKTKEAGWVQRYAVNWARAFGHRYVGSEHILMGLARWFDIGIFAHHGENVETIGRRVWEALGYGSAYRPTVEDVERMEQSDKWPANKTDDISSTPSSTSPPRPPSGQFAACAAHQASAIMPLADSRLFVLATPAGYSAPSLADHVRILSQLQSVHRDAVLIALPAGCTLTQGIVLSPNQMRAAAGLSNIKEIEEYRFAFADTSEEKLKASEMLATMASIGEQAEQIVTWEASRLSGSMTSATVPSEQPPAAQGSPKIKEIGDEMLAVMKCIGQKAEQIASEVIAKNPCEKCNVPGEHEHLPSGWIKMPNEMIRQKGVADAAEHFSLPPRVLCSKGCCFECEECSAKPGSPELCQKCLDLRAMCAKTDTPAVDPEDARKSLPRGGWF